jgi:hypothetical protein
MEDPKERLLFSEMIRLLVTYEVELTSYHLVFESVEREATKAGIQLNIRRSLKNLAASPALHLEARALYEPFRGLVQSMNSQNLDSALAGIKNLIARRNQEPSLDPTASDNSPVN